MTRDQLQAMTKKDLAELAKKRGIAGTHDLTKDDLLKAVWKAEQKRQKERDAAKTAKTPAAAPAVVKPALKIAAGTNGKAGTNGTHKPLSKPQKAAARDTSSGTFIEEAAERSKFDVGVPTKDLSAKVARDLPAGYGKDRVVVMVRDPFWLHVYWELTHAAVQRAEAALGQDWHGAKPILRVYDVTAQDTTSTSEALVKDIEIHGGCNNWYVEVQHPPRSYRVDIGYASKRGQFYPLTKSNVVATPRAGVSDQIDENWSDVDLHKADKLLAMSTGFDPSISSLELQKLLEERLRRPMNAPALSSAGMSSPGGPAGDKAKGRKFWFHLDAELIVYGATEPTARVTLQGEPVKLRADGTFTMRFSLPDSRQIIPAVAASADGVEERTIVLAVERNTKHLEPMIRDQNESA